MFTVTSYNCKAGRSPCDPENVIINGHYYEHDDPIMFVQCDDFGGCFDKECADGATWNDDDKECIHVL